MMAPKSAAERAGEWVARVMARSAGKPWARPTIERVTGLPDELRAKLAFRRALRKRKRVFVDDLGTWPKVWRLGENHYLISSRHETPRRNARPMTAARWLGLAVLVWTMLFVRPEPDVALEVGGAWLAVSVLLMMGDSLFTGPPTDDLRMEIQNGAVKWKATNGKVFMLGADQRYQIAVAAPHRLAAETIRNIEDRRRRKIIGANAFVPLTFEVASELIVYTGASLQFWNRVAELAHDEHGEKAHRLKGAIDHVIEYSQEEVRIADAKRRSTVEGTTDSGRYD